MKKILSVIVLLTLLAVSNVQAQSWKSLFLQGDATRAGAVYAAVCQACYSGSYNNDRGLWACTDAPHDGETPCLDALQQALASRYRGD